jgi:hypothetical protein
VSLLHLANATLSQQIVCCYEINGVPIRILNVGVGYHVLNPWQDNLSIVFMKNGIMTSKSEINLQNFYVYNSSFGQKEGEVSVNCDMCVVV